jgi:hypothetical protein
MDELNPVTVDVFISALSQTQGSRSGPIGRITDLKNGLVEHYDPGRSLPRRIKVKQRTGFRSLVTTGHDSSTGNTSNPSWSNPELLSSIGGQLLSIANAVPRVWDETDWTHYPDERVVSNILSQSVFHTSQRTIKVNDHAWIGGVTCEVWNEQPNPEVNTQIVYIGFKSDDGSWVRTPQVLYDSAAIGDSIVPFAKVKADGAGQYFWVVFTSVGASHVWNYTVKLFDLNGKEVNSTTSARVQQIYSVTAFWDIEAIAAGGLILAQPLNTVASATDGVKFTAFSQSAGVISSVTTDNSSIHCRGPLGWATNDLANGRHYLATIGLGEDPSGKLWGYEIAGNNFNPVRHEYDFEVEPAIDTNVDSLAGFVKVNTNPDNVDNIPDLTVSFTLLRTTGATSGAPFDPQLRYSQVWTCDFADNVTFERQNDFTCQVSRAFLHDSEYYTINYYQSGSGNLIQSTSVEVDYTAGDYMIGAKLQPVTVRNGDGTLGSAYTLDGAGPPFNNIYTSSSQGSFGILGTDTVEFVSIATPGFPVRTMLKWTLGNMSIDSSCAGGRLTLSGTSIPGSVGSWDILWANPTPSNYVYTSISSVNGGTVAAATFSAGGTGQVVSMTAYRLPTLGTLYDNVTKDDLIAGTAVVTANGTPANNGTKTIQRTVVGWTPDFDQYGLGPGFWITTGSESSSNAGFTAVLTPSPSANQWSFASRPFDEAQLIGPHGLVVEDDSFTVVAQQFNAGLVPTETAASNNSSPSYAITSVPDPLHVVTDGTAIVAEVMKPPLPKVTIRVPDDVTPLTFFLQSITPDYTYKSATLIVTSDSVFPENNGVYQIVDFDAAAHLLYCVAIDGRDSQRSQMFLPDDQGITIVFQTNIQPEFQPTWLMVPLTGTKPVVGRFESGLAYADWRYEGSSTPNLFPGALTSPVIGADGWLISLPYRAISFTVGQALAVNNQTVDAAVASNQSTVGIKQFQLSSKSGNATVSSTSLMLPGPMCGEFNSSGFSENGVNFGFEAPFLISQQVSSGAAALRANGSYQVVVVGEFTTESGDRVFSIVSPPLNFQLSGDNNSATYGIRMIQPLDSSGVPIAKHFGVTNRKLVGISLYRTAYENNAPTTDHHKTTLDLNINGLAPVSDTNDSGFSFPDEFTAQYLDENIDAAIIGNEVLYTDKGFLPRFPAPANRSGDFWKERTWIVGYDGAIWMSAEKKEGDASWFFPLWRIVLPTTDKPVAVSGMDEYLIVGCENSMWLVPNANFPNATGRDGTLPRPVQLPFTNGCTGFMKTIRKGVVYSSTDGGVWIVTRQLTNEFFSQTAQDTFGTIPITGMTVDKHQRLHVATGTNRISVYDQIIEMWINKWELPSSFVGLLSTLNGEVAFQDNNRVWLSDPSIFYDDLAGTKVGIPLDITFSSFQFFNVRGLKAVWEMQLIGDYKGPHNLNAVISYPDDDPNNPTVFPDPADGPYTPDPSEPYLMAINPMIIEASSFGLRVFADFNGIAEPGDSFELEVISCETGMDPAVGLNPTLDNQRITGV